MGPNAIAHDEASTVTAPAAARGGHFTPRVDVYETADEVVVLGNMPGVQPQDMDVCFVDGTLRVSGKAQPRRAPAECLWEEYGVGDFFRSMTIAPEIASGEITADCQDGVLAVHLPKRGRSKPKPVPIQVG